MPGKILLRTALGGAGSYLVLRYGFLGWWYYRTWKYNRQIVRDRL
jgi:hypothetical protein